ncbi:hypothetical protein HDV57DRAFT_351271 [Trichoderma longibrachiatum]|uniref:Uncharacterized protein n=1 Tax=Trichoderma longibrachiatum ATCC 18648 TaxID=983965 RepID=A0A2T4BR98_TRILO|nr:hypothetical protein M440DRAFT_1137384 [Trichoderma longibrachiatum ATCC 18648]
MGSPSAQMGKPEGETGPGLAKRVLLFCSKACYATGRRLLLFRVVISSSFCIFSMAWCRAHDKKKKRLFLCRLEGHEFGRTSLYDWRDEPQGGASGWDLSFCFFVSLGCGSEWVVLHSFPCFD